MRPAVMLPILAALAAGCGPREPPPTDGTLPAARPVQRIVSVHDSDTCRLLDDDREPVPPWEWRATEKERKKKPEAARP